MLPVIDARITGNIFFNFKFVFQSDYFIVENTKKAAAKELRSLLKMGRTSLICHMRMMSGIDLILSRSGLFVFPDFHIPDNLADVVGEHNEDTFIIILHL